MEQLQPDPSVPNIVQMYPPPPPPPDDKMQDPQNPENPQMLQLPQSMPSSPPKMVYEQLLPSDAASSSTVNLAHKIESIVMSCQSSLQAIQSASTQSQVAHLDIDPLQFATHMLVPELPMYGQHDDQHGANLGQYEGYKDQHYDVKDDDASEQDKNADENQIEYTQQMTQQFKRKRSAVPDPSTWACNIRKLKHQSGEAYISRRGKFVPERKIKSTKDCNKTCKYKCNKKITDSDRELIFKAFYSLTKNEKKHFLLNTTERHTNKNETAKRMHTFKYYFLVRGTRHSVCKNFYLGTLSISQKPIYNVHAGKSELNIPKPDGRGLSPSSYHGTPAVVKNSVRDHVMSFKTVDSSPIKQFSKKRQQLQGNLNVKRMYNLYLEYCAKDNIAPVKQSMYRKIVKDEFNLYFARKSDKLCAKCKEPLKKCDK